MPYHSQQEVDHRLANPGLLTEDEVLDMLPWMRGMSGNSLQRMSAEVAFMSVHAIRQFDKGSGKLARWMMALVGIQVILAVTQVLLVMHCH